MAVPHTHGRDGGPRQRGAPEIPRTRTSARHPVHLDHDPQYRQHRCGALSHGQLPGDGPRNRCHVDRRAGPPLLHHQHRLRPDHRQEHRPGPCRMRMPKWGANCRSNTSRMSIRSRSRRWATVPCTTRRTSSRSPDLRWPSWSGHPGAAGDREGPRSSGLGACEHELPGQARLRSSPAV